MVRKKMNKLLLIGVLSLLLVASVSAITIKWSNPSVGFPEPTPPIIKQDCNRAEVNQHFEDYRSGLISKDDMKTYVGGCRW